MVATGSDAVKVREARGSEGTRRGVSSPLRIFKVSSMWNTSV